MEWWKGWLLERRLPLRKRHRENALWRRAASQCGRVPRHHDNVHALLVKKEQAASSNALLLRKTLLDLRHDARDGQWKGCCDRAVGPHPKVERMEWWKGWLRERRLPLRRETTRPPRWQRSRLRIARLKRRAAQACGKHELAVPAALGRLRGLLGPRGPRSSSQQDFLGAMGAWPLPGSKLDP